MFVIFLEEESVGYTTYQNQSDFAGNTLWSSPGL